MGRGTRGVGGIGVRNGANTVSLYINFSKPKGKTIKGSLKSRALTRAYNPSCFQAEAGRQNVGGTGSEVFAIEA